MATGARRSITATLLDATLWFVVIVPPAFGFWLVAGDLAGVAPADFRTLLTASMLGVGIATSLQIVAGYKVPVFEGPAGNYLAAVAVIAVSSPSPAAATGGLIAAGILVFALGMLRADRLFGLLFTPPVVQAFLLIIVIVALPPAIERAIGSSPGAPFGHGAAWASAAVVIAVALAAQRVRGLRPFGLLGALVLGALTFFLLDGFPDPDFRSAAVRAPSPFPWGAPELSLSIAAPFLVAGLLAAFNTVASMRVMSTTISEQLDPGAGRRGLIPHGGSQALTACLGNVLGHVPRLDSSSVVRLIDNADRLALLAGAIAIVALAFVGPVIDVLAELPVPVSGALLTIVLGVLAMQGLAGAAAMDRRSRWLVLAPALIPALAWVPLAEQLSESARLLTNPLLVGVVLAIVLDHLVRRGGRDGTTDSKQARNSSEG